MGGAALYLTHSPDIFPQLTSGAVLFAGHTHCGQVAIPFLREFYIPSRFGDRYRCGRYEEEGKTLVVSGGIATSVIPLRLFAPPEWSLITIVPAPREHLPT
jgi:predicted MPP superfamily phosphohydrolase